MSLIHLQPTGGRRVRDPATGQPIPASGVHVPSSVYWARRLREGDVIQVDAAPGVAELPAVNPDSRPRKRAIKEPS